MRLHRLQLNHFRGVEARDVHFSSNAINLIVGPNESGKTTLIEALETVLMIKATGKPQRIKDIQPVGKDVSPEVTVEFSVGPHRIHLRKRWLKKTLTEVRIEGPEPRQLQGEEAHQAVQTLLSTEMDWPLFMALLLRQSQESTALPLDSMVSLHSHLGSSSEEETEVSSEPLYEAARSEMETFFTSKGKILKSRQDKLDSLQDIQKQIEETREQVSALEADSSSLERMERELARLADVKSETEARLVTLQQTEADIQVRQGNLERIALQLNQFVAVQERLEHQQTIRKDAETKLHATRERLREGNAEREELRSQLEHAEHNRIEAEVQVNERNEEVDLRRNAVQQIEELRQLLQTRKRYGEMREVQKAIAELDDAQEPPTAGLNQEQMRELEEAWLALQKTRARLESELPEIQLRAHSAFSVRKGESLIPLEKGEKWTQLVREPVHLQLGDFAELTVDSGPSEPALQQEVEQLDTRIQKLLHRAGAESVLDARRSAQKREEWQTARAQRATTRKTLLGGRSEEDFLEELTTLKMQIEGVSTEEPQVDVSDKGLEDARSAWMRGTEIAREAQATLEALRQRIGELRERSVALDARLEILAEGERELKESLSRETGHEGDEEALTQAKKEVESLRNAQATLQEELRTMGAAELQIQLESIRATHGGLDEQIQTLRTTVLTLRARLLERGEQGLVETLSHLEAEHAQNERAWNAEVRRANAARRLFTTLSEERDQARKRYQAPFRTQIETLGRVLYGPTFQVELSPQLEIESRSLDGVLVPLEQLSGGAQEQLDVVTRFAAGMLVAPSGGVPLILDETLVYTDPDRRWALGSLFHTLSQKTQVLVFTSDIGRFSAIAGQANIIRLEALD